MTLRAWFPPSPGLPGAPVREGPGTGPGCSVSDPLAELSQSASPGAEKSGMIRFVPELVQRKEPVWDERHLAPFSVWENICLFPGMTTVMLWGGPGDVGMEAGAGHPPSPA